MRKNGEMPLGEFRHAADEVAVLLRAMSNPARLMILCKLKQSERTVGQLERELDMGQAYVSQQLAQLREKDLVKATRDGRQMRYQLRDSRLESILGAVMKELHSPVH
ncbi:MAG: metalloregulator ArsR/SmtB family transcription factor [Pseudomonadota bacterium]